MMMLMMLVVMMLAADFSIAYGAKLEACTQMPEWKGRTENACRERTRATTRQKLQNVTAAKMTMMISNMFICVCVTANLVTQFICPEADAACPGQLLQWLEPVEGWYELMWQRHCCTALERQFVPAEQLVQDAEPGDPDNVPGGQ